MNIASYIDHTLLKQTTTLPEIQKLCEEAVYYRFAAVCVPPPFVESARKFLPGPDIKIATVIGFPLGYSAIEAKLAETLMAIVDGADELDMVINVSAIKNNDWLYLANEINTILPIARNKQKIIKIIIETGVLTDDEIIKCCGLYGPAGVDYLKTSSGFAEKGATVEAVQLMRKHLPSNIRIKASGGIKTYDFAKKLIDAGAERIGSSSSVEIVKQSLQKLA